MAAGFPRGAEAVARPLRRGHRRAHLLAVAAATVATFALLAYGWTVRVSWPTPGAAPPVLGAEPRPDGAAWEVVVETPDGAARIAFHRGRGGADGGDGSGDGMGNGGGDGPGTGASNDAGDGPGDGGPGLWVSLPPDLDAAEPGVVLEADGAPPRVLGSVTTGPPWVPTPGGLPAEGRLVLMDLARNTRLGETALPPVAPAADAPEPDAPEASAPEGTGPEGNGPTP